METATKHNPGSVDFSDVQIVHKFAMRMTPELDFKVTMFSNLKYIENGTTANCILTSVSETIRKPPLLKA